MVVSCLGVEHDGAENTGVLHGGAEVVEGFLVVLVGPMGEVEASHVHARPQKLLDHWDRARCGPQRARPTRSVFHILSPFCLICVYIYILIADFVFFVYKSYVLIANYVPSREA